MKNKRKVMGSSKNIYPQTAHTPCGHRQQRSAINFFMLKATAAGIQANHLTYNKLRDAPFRLPKRRVSQPETAGFASPNRPFCGAIWHIRKIKETEDAFSCVFASTGITRISISRRAETAVHGMLCDRLLAIICTRASCPPSPFSVKNNRPRPAGSADRGLVLSLRHG